MIPFVRPDRAAAPTSFPGAARNEYMQHPDERPCEKPVLLGGQSPECRGDVSRKERRPDERDRPVEPYDLYGPGASHDFNIIT
jgi:hypothetical protein